jgi:predicted RNA-binding protein
MCLSKAYVDTDGKRELLMEEVASIEFKEGRLVVKTLFGEQKEIKADIRQIDFLTHTIVLGNLEAEAV